MLTSSKFGETTQQVCCVCR